MRVEDGKEIVHPTSVDEGPCHDWKKLDLGRGGLADDHQYTGTLFIDLHGSVSRIVRKCSQPAPRMGL
jgi:hypothetical protein